MSDLYEMKAAVVAAKENCDLPILASLIFDGGGKLLTGGLPQAAVALLEGLGVDVIGLNCGLGPGRWPRCSPGCGRRPPSPPPSPAQRRPAPRRGEDRL